MNALTLAALGTGFTFLMTAAGAAVVFLFKNEIKPSFQRVFLGFAAGVMIAASVWSLLIPSIEMAGEQGVPGWLPAAGGFALGRVLTVSTKGIEFVMTALFVTIFTGQWMEDREHRPALVGLGASVLCLALFGAGNFILPAMALIVLLLLVMRPALDKKGAVR